MTTKFARNGILASIYSKPSILAMMILFSRGTHAENYFNPAFLSNDPSAVADLSHFSTEGSAPGTYRVDIYVNNKFIVSKDIVFQLGNAEASAVDKASKNALSENSGNLEPCFTAKDLDTFGVNLNALPGLKEKKADTCISLEKYIKGSATDFNFEQLKLYISIPQAILHNDARGYIPPDQWDEGINALLLNYNFTGSNSWTDGDKETSDFLSLQSGLNLGAWRLRDSSSWNYNRSDSGESQSDIQHISTYVERSIVPLKGEFVAGDTSSSNDIFDSLPFRGVKLSSDDNMLPDSMKGFAPTIRGIAKSNAKITIAQNGYTIYQTYVSPGAFAINDLYPTSSSGDLQVTVEETDGSTSSYTVPFSAVPLLQREGRVKYDINVGEYRSGNNDQQDDPVFGQGTLIWGLSKGYTVYGGLQYSNNYRSVAVGLGKNFGDFGAISTDITQANSTLADGSDHQGQSMRFLYAKTLNSWGTDFQLLGYRYSTEGFYTLDETAYKMMNGYTGDTQTDRDGNIQPPNYADYYNLYYTKRGKIQVSVSQQAGSMGSVFISGSQQSYWHTSELNTLLQAGYNGSLWGITYSLTYNYNKAPEQPVADQMFAFNMSVPLSQWLTPSDSNHLANSAYATYNNNTDNHGNVTQQAGINGTLLEDNNLNYSVTEGYGNNGVGNSGDTSLSYQGGYGNANAGYNYSKDYRQVNYGVSGGVILHRNGITLSQPLGDTNVLVAAPGADNVGVENNTGVKTDWRGYAVVPYANTYQLNRIALDTNMLDSHTDLDETVTNVVPTQGALVRASFNARVGVRALFTLTQKGKPLPFGATVSRTDGGSSIVGDSGQVYLSGLPLTGILKAQWGKGADEQCSAAYSMPADSLKKSIVYAPVICQ